MKKRFHKFSTYWASRLRPLLVDFALSGIRFSRPLFGPANICIYRDMTCTEYAAWACEHYSLPRATLKITLRFISCNPITQLFRLWEFHR